jgi:hypothetical protein
VLALVRRERENKRLEDMWHAGIDAVADYAYRRCRSDGVWTFEV